MTAVPATIDAVLALFKAATVIDKTVEVIDGPWIDAPSQKKDVIVVGNLPDEGFAVEWVADPASLGLGDDSEAFTIHGVISVNRGAINHKTVRDRADHLFELCRGAIHMNNTLGGIVGRAHMAALSAMPYEDADGAAFTINFSIAITVY